ncbi:MAG: ATP-dependent DNA ligase [Syntrophales bacterium]
MEFLELAQTFAKVEATTKRSEISAFLADAFRQADSQEAKFISYLIHGRLGPPYSAPDLGINERRIAEGIAQVVGKDIDEVWTLYKTSGDFGIAAESLFPEQGKRLSIQQVYNELLKVARMTGPGSTELKLKLFARLLSQLGKLEARYFVRIAQGKLRLGVGDAIVIDALSQSRGDHPLRDKIERAYIFSSDLGLVAYTLLTEGEKGVEKIGPTPGRPILPALAQRVPSLADAVERLGSLIAEPKYDGFRLQLHKDGDRIWLFTRSLEDITYALPGLVASGKVQVFAGQAVLDGELVAFDPKTSRSLPFQQTVRRKRKYQVEEMEFLYPARYYCFDLLFLDGQDFTPKPLDERLQALEKVIKEDPAGLIFKTFHIETESVTELEDFFDQMVEMGHEGVVVKRKDAPYHAGARLFNWIKLKREQRGQMLDTFDLVVVGYFKGRGKRSSFGIGSLLCAVYDPENDRIRTVSRVGSGLSDEEWKELRKRLDEVSVPRRPPQVDSLIEPDVWVEPRLVIEVAAAEVTRSPHHTCGKVGDEKGYSLRFPRVTRFRFDRRPEDATTEKEIVELYKKRDRGKGHR